MSQEAESRNDYIKKRTQELYDSLPQDRALREARLDVRDELVSLNYSFFGYIASHTFINNSSVTYEDKLQSALTHFCEIWWRYKWTGEGDEKHKGYRTDLSFGVFFKPRIGEMIERELNEVKYSIRRSLCMEVGKQLGKHWGQVKYEDLAKVNLPPDKMNSLKTIFGTLYTADLAEHELFLESPEEGSSILDEFSEKYDTIEELLVHEMIEEETKLDDEYLLRMAEMYQLDFKLLKEKLPVAEEMLHKRLHDMLDMHEGF